MAESICRALRDGVLEGEQAPALTIKDSAASPFGVDVFTYILMQLSSNIMAGKSQSQGLVIIAFSHGPSFYLDLLKRKGVDTADSHKWIRILDCYTDPLGWKARTRNRVPVINHSLKSSHAAAACENVKDMDNLFSLINEVGKGMLTESKLRFSVAIDSVSEMLRHTSAPSVARLLSNLRNHDQISSVFWLLHSDLHDDRVTATLEYISSVVANVEPLNQAVNGERGNLEKSFVEHNRRKGKFIVRLKRRNGRVRVMIEEFGVERSGISFTSVMSEANVMNQGLVQKVQFNLQLSDKERNDRASVVLPFEHQGNGEPIKIYDGRRSLRESEVETGAHSSKQWHAAEAEAEAEAEGSGRGEIIYFRDSDDEMPDSDEDPDDDLDI